MRWLLPALLWTAVSAATPLPETHSHPHDDTFSNVTIFYPPADYSTPRTLYPRTVQLPSGALLATWENYSPEPPLVYFPIHRSLDGGRSWHPFSRVTDQVNGWGLRYQPFLYYLPESIGRYPAGTILCAGNSIPANLSKTQIDLYASRDDGYTWEFVSHIAAGGEAEPDNGLTPVWEPFLLAYEGKLVCFYSDQRDPAHGQKLSHQVSADLLHWDAPSDDVAYPTYTDRPGMTTVTHLPNGQWMMTYEFGGGPVVGASNSTYGFPVYYRIAASPLLFNKSVGQPLIAKSANGMQIQPQSSPYLTWSPVGGDNGTIVVSSGTYEQVFLNRALGASGAWKAWDTPQVPAYTRHLRILPDPTKLLIMGAGLLPPSNANWVNVSVIALPP